MLTLRLSAAFLATGSLFGCLSIDAIPTRRELDAGAMTDAPSSSSQARAYPTKECVAGESEPCLFWLRPQHGAVKSQRQFGDHVYWVEVGTTDAFNNYTNDGAIVRTKLGEWKREELATGLSFWSERYADVHSEIDLTVSEEHVFWMWRDPPDYGSQHLTIPGVLHRPVADIIIRRDHCAYLRPYQYCEDRYSGVLLRRDASTGEPFSAWSTGPVHIAGASSRALYAFMRADSVLRSWRLPDLTETVLRAVPARPLLAVTPDDQLMSSLPDGRIGVYSDASEERWKPITEVVNYLGINGAWIFWSQKAAPTLRNVVDDSYTIQLGRTSLNGGRNEALAEIDHDRRSWDDYQDHTPEPGSLGFAVTIEALGPDGEAGFRFVPFPAN